MRILLISHTCQSATEGQPRAAYLAAIPGVQLRVLLPDRWKHYGQWRRPQLPAPGAAFHYHVGRVALPWAGPAQFYLHYYPGLARILADFRPDVIDLWEEPWSLVSAQACRLRNRLLPAAAIVCETEQNISKRLPFPFEFFRSFTVRNADFAVARSAEAGRVLQAKGYAGPLEVVPNGVDAQLFRPLDRRACRADLGIPPAAFVAGYAGRLVEEKGLADLLDALPACDRSVCLFFVGSGPMRAVLKRRARAHGRADQLRFLPACSPAELPRMMNAFDCLVLPSRTTPRWKEQFGRVLAEAGACGIPVIGTDSGAIPEVIGDAGLVVPERNPARLAAAIESLRLNPGLATRCAAAGRLRAEQRYAWPNIAAQMHRIYSQVLSRRPAAARIEHEPVAQARASLSA